MQTNSNSGVKITKTVVDKADLARGRHILWDSELRGFGLQVEPTGTKTYLVRYRLKGTGRAGSKKFFKLGRHGDLTPDQAREYAKVTLGRIANGEDPARDREIAKQTAVERREAATFASLAKRFLDEHVATKRKTRTHENYETLLRLHILPRLGAKIATEVSEQDVAKLHDGMHTMPTNANRALTLVASIYNLAAKRKWLPVGLNPACGIEKFREDPRERYLTEQELKRLGDALVQAETIGIPWIIDHTAMMSKHTPKIWKGQRELADPYAVAAIRLLLLTGARLREILHLRWRNVDLGRGLLFLDDSKTGKKTITLNIAAITIVRDLQVKCLASGALRPEDVVIIGADPATPRSDLKRPWSSVRRQAGLDGVRLHDLRHTFASIGAGASLGLPIVGKLLGHTQPQTTARYAHLDADPLRKAANIIGDVLSSAMNSTEHVARKCTDVTRVGDYEP